jgi:CheY-like chemotaxis protein
LTLIDGKNSLTCIAERSGIVAKEVARILHRLGAVDLIAAPVHRPSSRRGPRPVMILEPDREGFHSPLRMLLQNRSEPLELVDLAGEPDLLSAITREQPALVILNDAACDANVGDMARAIRALPMLANVSLAAVLESRAKAKMDDLAAAGFDAVLVKPVLYSDLSKLIASSFLAAQTASPTREGESHEDSRRG